MRRLATADEGSTKRALRNWSPCVSGGRGLASPGVLALVLLGILGACAPASVGVMPVAGKSVLYSTVGEEISYVVFTDINAPFRLSFPSAPDKESEVRHFEHSSEAIQFPLVHLVGADNIDIDGEIFPLSDGRVFLYSKNPESLQIHQLRLATRPVPAAIPPEREIRRLSELVEVEYFLYQEDK